ncbi:MAG: hypothetical protein ACM3X3_10790 [Betaproteobacteria bacterium]
MRSLARLSEAIQRGEGIDRWQVYEFCKAIGETRVLAGMDSGTFAGSIQAALMHRSGPNWYAANREEIQEGIDEYLRSDWPAQHDVRRAEASAS